MLFSKRLRDGGIFLSLKNIPKQKNTFTSTVLCEHKRCLPSEDFQYHIHPEFEIFMFLHGDVSYIVEENIYALSPGDILIFNSTELHYPTFRSDAEFERIVLHFDPGFAQQFSSRTPILRRFVAHAPGDGNLIRLPDETRKTVFSLAECISHECTCPRDGDDILAAAHLAELLVLLDRAPHNPAQSGGVSPYIRSALQYLSDHVQQPFSLLQMAQALSVDRFHLEKNFKKEVGITPYRYLLIKRLNLARTLLSQGCSVDEACAGAGFNDYSNFIRTFKKHTGTTPAAYARAARSDRKTDHSSE